MLRKNLKQLLLVTFGASVFTVGAQNGEATFKQVCGACHSIGNGKLVGPDLKDVAKRRTEEWILKFVKGSQAFIKSGDPDAKAIYDQFNMVMPDQNLPDADIKAIIAYITEQSGAAAAAPVAEAKPDSAATKAATPEMIAMGKAYYEGSKRFINGGPSCISCHNVNYPGLLTGGLLAKDLTNSYGRLGGEAGLNGILSAPPFPAMTSAFKNAPMTPEEINALMAFLKDADQPANATAAKGTDPLLAGGLIGFVVIIILIILLWNKRKTTSTKNEYHDRQTRAIN